MRIQSPLTLIILLVSLASLLLFWRINTRGINSWDEARNGVNAYEMLQNGDPVNLYYGKELDTWNAKPPLVIWMIAGCYSLFGANCFSLRLPSALCTIGFFIFIYLLTARSKDKRLALLTCGILLSCKAAIGTHLGLTGDFDAPLIFFLAASAYYFFSYLQEGKSRDLIITAVFTGLAWYIKGLAGLLYLPGFFLFGTIRKGNLKWILKQEVFIACFILMLVIISWIAMVAVYGKTNAVNHYASGNAIRTMLVEDTWHRLTSSSFEGGQAPDYFFFISVIDARLNLWNYLFYLSIGLGLYKASRYRSQFYSLLRKDQNGLILFAMCILVPPALMLTFAANKYSWYLAPIFWAIAVITARGLLLLINRSKWVLFPVALLLVFGFGRQLFEINQSANSDLIIPKSIFDKVDSIRTLGAIDQDIYLQLVWSVKAIFKCRLHDRIPYPRTLEIVDSTMQGLNPAMLPPTICNVKNYLIGIWL